MRSVFAIPKETYFLRSAATFKASATLELYDQQMRRGLEDILNVELQDKAWDQSSLPVKQGGLGIRKASDPALPAFLSSGYGAASVVRDLLPSDIETDSYQELIDAENAWAYILNNNAEQPSNLSVQALWDAPMYKKKYQDLLNEESVPAEKAVTANMPLTG